MHVILVAALPVDASGEAVLFKDLLDLAAHGDGVGIVLRVEFLAGEDRSVRGYIGIGQIIDIDGGAGRITISDGALHNLDLDMGVGQLNLTSALTGESDFDLGIGESNITVIGNKDDYKLDIEKGIGNITVDGTSVSNIKEYGNGNNSIEVSGGIGAINLRFQEE